jgi:cyclopropane fatty-acyl-phospholipid synthase-like methyltransferase
MSGQSLYLDGEYLARNPAWHLEESPWKATQILHMLRRNHLAPKTICDVGCGAGEVLKQLQQNLGSECAFWGYDISPQAYELAKSRANQKLEFRLADFLEETDTCFDLILALDVIEHLEDYFSFLRKLKPRSRYTIFHIPLDLSVQTVFRRNALLKRRNLYAHLHYFTKETALRTLKDTGYEVLDYFYTRRSIQFGSEAGEKLLKVPRKAGFAISEDWTARLLGGFSLLVLAR